MKSIHFATLGLLTLALSLTLGLFACKSLPTIQEQFNTLCPVVTADLKTLSTSPLFGASDQKSLASAANANGALCTAGGTLNVTDLKAFHDSLLPAAVALVQNNPLIPDQTAILLALNTIGPIVQNLIDQAITAVATVQAASAATAASAPVPASQ